MLQLSFQSDTGPRKSAAGQAGEPVGEGGDDVVVVAEVGFEGPAVAAFGIDVQLGVPALLLYRRERRKAEADREKTKERPSWYQS